MITANNIRLLTEKEMDIVPGEIGKESSWGDLSVYLIPDVFLYINHGQIKHSDWSCNLALFSYFTILKEGW